jgi:Fe-S-cluster containining protein
MNAPRPVLEPSRAMMRAQPDAAPRGPIRRLLRRLAREAVWPIVLLLEAGHRFGRVLLRTEYEVGGACDQRGACCHHILMEWSPLLDAHPRLARLVLWKLTRFYSFFDKGYTWEVEDGLLVRVLGCHALGQDGRCTEYRLRPLFCRTYPEVPLTGRPRVLAGCGYRFPRRDGQPEAPEQSELVQIGRRPAEPPGRRIR